MVNYITKAKRKMEERKIISFEEYRKRKAGNSFKEDPLSEVFKKDLREQKELLEWYSFHEAFNKHKLFLHLLFRENRQKGQNLDSGFLAMLLTKIDHGLL